MTSEYWPLELNISQCIRTEAEELSEQVLLAVHELVLLEKRLAGENTGEKATEDDLLEHLITTDRPIPIIGESGVGKSHLIRWLDAQLSAKKNDAWHIIRIPKNASLRQVLESLLKGLEGELFEAARLKISEVGENLKTQELADHLIVFISHRLTELYENAEKEIAVIRQSGQQPDNDTKKCLERIKRHAKRGGLPALLGDSNYKELLVSKNKCLYQIAKRLTRGSTETEIEANNYEIRIEDLDFNLNLSDLSLKAQQYIRSASLNTDIGRRQEATDLLNEVLSDACGIAFSQLFQFHGGSFQDLFIEIRKYLYKQNKTLFILVEDMAAISAIEDVLVDSLMQEAVRDGIEELCSLHSALAVTDGYIGYTRRRNTLATRAKSEWYINKFLDSEEKTYQRIEDFCGRYLNAARYGEAALKNKSNVRKILPIWESGDAEEQQKIECFGRSIAGFSLFPFNQAALKALADKYCRPNQDLEFNPRKILGQILLNILPHFRISYTNGKFPPPKLADINCPTTLISALSREINLDLDRVQTVAAIWGDKANNLSELAAILPAEIAKEFSLEEFSHLLENIKPSKIKTSYPEPVRSETKKEINEKKVEISVEDKLESKQNQLAKDLDGWFDKKNIPQTQADILRQSLLKECKNIKSDWYGVKKLPELKPRLTLIFIPYNTNNPNGCLLSFGTEKEFNSFEKSLPYREFILAVLRNNLSESNGLDSWNYDEGYEDYCTYINFINDWLPQQIQKLVESERDKTKPLLEMHLGIAVAFDSALIGRSIDNKINMLVRPTNEEANDLGQSLEKQFSETGISEWDDHLKNMLASWKEKQEAWLNLYATNRHAFEGDLIKKQLHGSTTNIPKETKKLAQSLSKSLAQQFKVFELLDSCTTKQQFYELLTELDALVSALSSANQFKLNDDTYTARKYLNLITKIKDDDYWIASNSLLMLRKPFEICQSITALNQVDLKLAKDVQFALETWQDFYQTNLMRMKNENIAQGNDKRENAKLQITQVIDATVKHLQTLNEAAQ